MSKLLAMMMKPKNYMYATIKGTLTENDGVFSGFSASNYLELQQPFSPTGSWEIVCKFTIGNSISEGGIITGLGTTDSIAPFYLRPNGNLIFFASSNGTSWNIVGDAKILKVEVNTTYIVKLEFTGSNYNAYSLENGEWVLKKSVSSSLSIYGGIPLVIGNNRGSNNEFTGSIDLNYSYIKIGNTKYQLQAVVGYTKVGNPTITAGVVSGFSDSNYLTIDTILSGDYIENEICFTTGSSILPNVTQVVITSDLYGIVVASSIKVWDSDISAYRDIVPSNDLSVDTKYKIKYVKNGNNFKFSYSKNDGAYINSLNYSKTNISYGTMRIGNGASGYTNRYFQGSIDLNKTYIKVNNKLWFNGQPAE